ncbi:MAG: lipid A-modifier LpxR family protein, partial [Gemmatimonadaceae bacterium]
MPIAALGLVVAVAHPVASQQPRDSTADAAAAAPPRPQRRRHHPRSSPWLPRRRLDNDAYNFWIHPGHRSDEEYTNGVVASLETLRGSFWGRHFGGGAPDCGADTTRTGRCLTTTLSLGQEMYTPNLFRPPYSTPRWEDERPYAGWLYVAGTGRSVSSRSLRQVDVALGVTG